MKVQESSIRDDSLASGTAINSIVNYGKQRGWATVFTLTLTSEV